MVDGQGLALLMMCLSKSPYFSHKCAIDCWEYTLDELKQLSMIEVDNILNICAVLIDGPYIADLNNNCGLRGSSNQCVHIFRHHDRYVDYEMQERKIQTVAYGNSMLMIGIPRRKSDD